jgi:hypothetical protein
MAEYVFFANRWTGRVAAGKLIALNADMFG